MSSNAAKLRLNCHPCMLLLYSGVRQAEMVLIVSIVFKTMDAVTWTLVNGRNVRKTLTLIQPVDDVQQRKRKK